MNPVMLHTKTMVPPADDSVVERTARYSDILTHLKRNDAFIRKLTLVSAPAGFGKTTAVRSWISHSNKQTAWYSMDEQDNHPITFWSYMINALQKPAPDTFHEAKAILTSHDAEDPGINHWRQWVIPLLNECIALKEPALLVIDDFHFATSEELLASMAYFIEHLPPTIHVIITTRERPNWPLVKWQVKGWLHDVDEARLRFSIPEAETLFQKRDVHVDRQIIEKLVSWTEGWITGLELSLLSRLQKMDLDDQRDVQGDTHLTVFLTEEVLKQCSKEMIQFMEESAVLHKFSIALCEAVLYRKDSKDMLENLQTSQLFLVRLNEEGSWFRYHHIMEQILVDRLKKRNPERLRQLHQLASDWFSEHHELQEAIHHARKIEDHERMAVILNDHAEGLTYSSEPVVFIELIDQLPDRFTRTYPKLFAYKLFYRLLMKGHDGCKPLLDEARTLRCETDEEQETYEGMLDVLSFFYWTGRHQFETARQFADEALKKLHPDNYFWRMSAAVFSGDLLYYAGAPEEAFSYFEEAHQMNMNKKRYYFALSTELKLAVTWYELGKLDEAEAAIDRTHALAEMNGFKRIGKMGFVWTLQGELAREKGELNQAESLIEKGYALLPREQALLAWHYLYAGKLLYSQGRLVEALQTVNRVIHSKQEDNIPRYMVHQALKRKITVLMKMGEESKAIQALEKAGLLQEEVMQQIGKDLYATILFVTGSTGSADQDNNLNILGDIRRTAKVHGRMALYLETSLIQFALLSQQSMTDKTDKLLEEVIPLSRSCGYFQTLLDEQGMLAEPLSRFITANRGTTEDRLFVTALLEKIQPPDQKETVQQLIEPLSQREIEILTLISQGYSNQQIAGRLYLTVGTVKWHTSNIYGKLGVNRRTQAVAMAKQAGIHLAE